MRDLIKKRGGVAALSGQTRIGQKCPVFTRGPSSPRSQGRLALVNGKSKCYCYYIPVIVTKKKNLPSEEPQRRVLPEFKYQGDV